MSKEVYGKTEIRNKLILKKTLEEMRISYKEISEESIQWGSGYDKMTINLATGDLRYDHMRENKANELQQIYSKHFIMQEILKKGHKVESVQSVNGNIEIIAGY